ncbi:hypothetical protein [Paracoccus sp. (in: a-proteobacteria)]|uniref:hypothetical protein n=1 Tax=Paracoccus sp. TaxID=267 RepID=UPI0035B28899
MKPSTRILWLLLLIELLLMAGAAFMVRQVTTGAWHAPDPAEALRRILTVAGGVIPLVALPFVVIFTALRRKGR